MQVRVVYDFEAQANSNELSLRIGDIVTVMRQDVGDGWWEGVNEVGSRGLFPETYVEVIEQNGHHGPPPLAPPPPLPDHLSRLALSSATVRTATTAPPFDASGAAVRKSTAAPSFGGPGAFQGRRDSWGDGVGTAPAYTPVVAADRQASSVGDFDDDWSDDDESQAGDHHTTATTPSSRKSRADLRDESPSSGASGLRSPFGRGRTVDDAEAECSTADETAKTEPISMPSYKNFTKSSSPRRQKTEYNQSHTVITSGIELSHDANRNRDGKSTAGSVMKSMNRFSPFVKSGTENYLLNAAKLSSKPGEIIELEWTKDGPQWPAAQPYTCHISSHQKASKLHGLKTFIAYQLTPSINNLVVSRRYKHFDWLFVRLQEKYTVILIPPLPEKQVTGRYEDDFVEHRMQLLQLWLNKICRHPVLSQSDVWMHFLTCTDEKEWKRGKRKAEKDEYSGGLLFYAVKMPPNQSIDLAEADQKIDAFYRCCRLFEESVRNFHSVASDNAKRMIGPFKREFCKMGGAFRSLAGSFEVDQSNVVACRRLASALHKTGDCYELIGRAYEEQPKVDCIPLLNELFLYKGLLGNVPDVLQVHKSACSKYRESQKLAEEGRITGQELDSIRSRVDTISCATLAEICEFQKERLIDFNALIRRYLNEQICLYQGIVDKLKEAASKFEE